MYKHYHDTKNATETELLIFNGLSVFLTLSYFSWYLQHIAP